ncbi:MAG: SDR family oxidoreductase [Thermodesulfobacteriota bacterium]|nr:SDR family oxidoreductase [Thermodesulfobacteriota bacterium]
MKAVVITGVSTGIGEATAKLLARAEYHVFGSVRKKEDAGNLQDQLGDNFTSLIFDVTDETAVTAGAEIVKNSLGNNDQLVALINNAAISVGGPILHIDIESIRKVLEVNLIGVISVTKAFASLLGAYKGAKNTGKIINLSSISGKFALPFMGPYTASKFALEGLSDSLRRELLLYGIDVIVVEPGPIKTPIWDKVPDIENSSFRGTDYELSLKEFYDKFVQDGKKGLAADAVGKLIKTIIEKKKVKTRYVITKNKIFSYYMPTILPERSVDKRIAKLFRIQSLMEQGWNLGF